MMRTQSVSVPFDTCWSYCCSTSSSYPPILNSLESSLEPLLWPVGYLFSSCIFRVGLSGKDLWLNEFCSLINVRPASPLLMSLWLRLFGLMLRSMVLCLSSSKHWFKESPGSSTCDSRLLVLSCIWSYLNTYEFFAGCLLIISFY